MRKLQEKIDKTSILLSSVLMGIMMVVLIYNVFARFLGGGISWYMEFSQYANIWALMIAGIGITACGQHLRISALDEVLKGKALIALKLVGGVCIATFYLLFAYGSFLLATKSKQAISTMPSLKMAYVYWIMPVSGVLSALSAGLNTAIEVGTLLKGEDGR